MMKRTLSFPTMTFLTTRRQMAGSNPMGTSSVFSNRLMILSKWIISDLRVNAISLNLAHGTDNYITIFEQIAKSLRKPTFDIFFS